MTCQGSNLPKVTQLSGVRSWDYKNLLLPQSSALPTEAALPPCTLGNNNNTTHEQVIPSKHQVIPEEGWMNSYVVNSRSWSSPGLPMNTGKFFHIYTERRKKDKEERQKWSAPHQVKHHNPWAGAKPAWVPQGRSCLDRDTAFQVQKCLANLTYPAQPPRCACGFKYFLVAALKARTDTISQAPTALQLGGGGGGGGEYCS